MASGGQWSTQKINDLLDQFHKTGSMPKNNPFHMGNVNLRAANLNFEYTMEELLEMAKCKENILHFGETHCKVMTDEGNRFVKLRRYQKKTLLQLKKYRFHIWLASRQIGKCVTFDTLVGIYDERTMKMVEIPIFEIHYGFRENLNRLHKLEYRLFKTLFRLKIWMNRLENS